MLERMRVFCQIVESGSFSRAGQVLHMAPSSVARTVDNLEAQLGIVLFRRTTRQLILTEAGEALLPRAHKLLDDAEQLVQSLRPTQSSPAGTLRVSVFESFGAASLSPLLPKFLDHYPEIRLEVELENRVVDLDAENVDVAVRIGRPPDSSLNARRLLANRSILCASPGYLARAGLPTNPEAVAEHNCLVRGAGRQRNYWYFSRGRQQSKVAVRGNLASVGGTPLLAAALGDGGLLLLSSWMVRPVMAEGRLQVVLPDWQVSPNEQRSDEIYAVYRGGRYLKPAVRAFIDFLAETVTPEAFG